MVDNYRYIIEIETELAREYKSVVGIETLLNIIFITL